MDSAGGRRACTCRTQGELFWWCVRVCVTERKREAKTEGNSKTAVVNQKFALEIYLSVDREEASGMKSDVSFMETCSMQQWRRDTQGGNKQDDTCFERLIMLLVKHCRNTAVLLAVHGSRGLPRATRRCTAAARRQQQRAAPPLSTCTLFFYLIYKRQEYRK